MKVLFAFEQLIMNTEDLTNSDIAFIDQQEDNIRITNDQEQDPYLQKELEQLQM